MCIRDRGIEAECSALEDTVTAHEVRSAVAGTLLDVSPALLRGGFVKRGEIVARVASDTPSRLELSLPAWRAGVDSWEGRPVRFRLSAQPDALATAVITDQRVRAASDTYLLTATVQGDQGLKIQNATCRAKLERPRVSVARRMWETAAPLFSMEFWMVL